MKKYILSIAPLSLLAIVLIFGLGPVVSANPIFFPVTTQTATATSSPAFMTAGTATSTLTLDTYSSGNPRGAMMAALLIQFVASSTSSVLNTNIEYSQDNVDWYQDGGNITTNFATSSKPFDISSVNQYRYGWLGTQAGLPAVVLTTGTTTRALYVRTPTRYVRAIFTLPVGSAAGAVWGQFVPTKEVAE